MPVHEVVQYSTVSEKGLVVIPKAIREKWGLKKGDRVAFVEWDGRVTVMPVPAGDPIEALRGLLAPARLDIVAAKREELELEERDLPPPRRRERRVAEDVGEFKPGG